MEYYAQADYEAGRAGRKSAVLAAAAAGAPFFVLAAAGFFLRIQALCMAAAVLGCCTVIFLYDLKVKPAVCYAKFLREIEEGSSHRTLGTLVRVSSDLTYEDGVDFREVIINIYEDMAEEGERRFLLDARREIPLEWLGSDVVLTSYGSRIVGAQLYAPGESAKA